MSDDFQYDPWCDETLRTEDGVIHIVAFVAISSERVTALCRASARKTCKAHNDPVDCMTCLVLMARCS